MQKWKSDRFIWQLPDGSFKSADDERMRPAMAIALVAKKGEEISRSYAAKHGWITLDSAQAEKRNSE